MAPKNKQDQKDDQPDDKNKSKPSQTTDDIKRMEFEGSMTAIDQPYDEEAARITKEAPLPKAREAKEKAEEKENTTRSQ